MFDRHSVQHLLKWDELSDTITVGKGPDGVRRVTAKVKESNALAMHLIDKTKEEM